MKIDSEIYIWKTWGGLAEIFWGTEDIDKVEIIHVFILSGVGPLHDFVLGPFVTLGYISRDDPDVIEVDDGENIIDNPLSKSCTAYKILVN